MSERKLAILECISVDYARRPCPNGVNPEAHADRETVREMVGCLACDLVRILPEGRELNHALIRLDEAVMWAHAAIDRHGASTLDPPNKVQ